MPCNFPVKSELELPGFFRRFTAQLIDSSLSFILIVILLFPPIVFFDVPVLQLIVSFLGLIDHPLYDARITYVGSAYLLVIVYAWLKFQTTPGKRLMSLKIVQFETNDFPIKKQFALRSLGYVLAAIPFGLGYLWIFLDKNNRGWHDHFSGTQVVYIPAGEG